MASPNKLPPLPAGFQLEQPGASSLPPMPDGFQLEHGPWEDFQQAGPAAEQGPWTEFAGNTPAPADAPVTTGGLAKAAAAGALSGTVGLPGDVTSLVNLARRGYAKLTGGTYDPAKDDYSLGQTYNSVRNAADQVYTPQNNAEGWAKTIGEYAPALFTGPEEALGKGGLSAARVLAKRAAFQAALPAAASTMAGAATQGTEAEPYARVGAALFAGGVGTKGLKAAPVTSEDVAQAANKNFSDFRTQPVTVKPSIVEDAAKNIQNDLTAAGLSKAPANDIVAPYIGNTAPVSLNQLQETRSLLGKAAARSDTPDAVAAIKAKGAFDNLMSNLAPTDTVVGANALPRAMEALKQGRQNALVQNQLGAIEGKEYRGNLNDAASNSEVGAQGLRQQVKSLLVNPREMGRLAPYKTDMERIVNGTLAMNTLRRLGTLSGGTGGWHNGPYWLGSLLASEMGHPFVGAAVGLTPFAGMGLRKMEAALVQSKIGALKAKIASQATGLPQQAAPTSVWPTRALIGTLAANGASGK